MKTLAIIAALFVSLSASAQTMTTIVVDQPKTVTICNVFCDGTGSCRVVC